MEGVAVCFTSCPFALANYAPAELPRHFPPFTASLLYGIINIFFLLSTVKLKDISLELILAAGCRDGGEPAAGHPLVVISSPVSLDVL